MKNSSTEPKNDKEIYLMALADWYSILEGLWIAIGKPVDKKRLKIYAQELSNVPIGLLERAIRRIRMTSTFSSVPAIGEIWRAVRVELENDNCSSPEEWVERQWIRFFNRAVIVNGTA